MFAISSGVASLVFHRSAPGMEAEHHQFRRPTGFDARPREVPAADSATVMSPAAGAKTSADSSVTSCVRRPAPSGVSGRHFSSFTSFLVSRTGTGEPSAGGSIQMEFARGGVAAERSGPARPRRPLRAGSYLSGDLKFGVHLRIGGDQGTQQLRLFGIDHDLQRSLARAARSTPGRPEETRREH